MNEARSLSRQRPVRQEGNRVLSALRYVGYLLFVIGYRLDVEAAVPAAETACNSLQATKQTLGHECNYRGYQNYDGANINAEQRTLFRAA